MFVMLPIMASLTVENFLFPFPISSKQILSQDSISLWTKHLINKRLVSSASYVTMLGHSVSLSLSLALPIA